MSETYYTATADKIANDQILVKIIGPLDQQAKLFSFSLEEFRAIYRLVFSMMKDELTKPEAADTIKHGD
jgi:hypothetical protein